MKMRKRFLKGILLALKINFNITIFGLGLIIILFVIGSKGIGAGIFFGIYYFVGCLLIKKLWKAMLKNAPKITIDKRS